MNMINPDPKKRGLKYYYFRVVLGVFITAVVIASVIYAGRYFYSLQNSDENNGGGGGDGVDIRDPAQFTWEIDAEDNATYIVDGDTFDVEILGRIRLADIDCPDEGEPNWLVAKAYLTTLIYHEIVYLDIDDKYGTDSYGRTVAMVYVRYNETHLLNVNKDLLEQGIAVIWDCDNEFTPSLWPLYVYYL